MPELDIKIGGKVFQVSCQAGEERLLQTAAAYLDAEAQPLVAHAPRLPEAKMLLMAGLMLADRMAELSERLRAAEEDLRVTRERVGVLASMPAPQPEKIEVIVERLVEVPVVPPALVERLTSLADDAEALAEIAEERAGALADLRDL